jgi:hypothetical protein
MDPIVLIPISILFLGCMILGRNEIVRRTLTCPRTGGAADVEIVRRSLRPAKLVGIRSCTLLADPRRIDCGQACLKAGGAS